MTDNEVIKALECCRDCEDCSYDTTDCPLGKELNCFTLMAENALDLINRQNAEIKRLNTLAKLGNMRANDYRAMRDKLKKANAEIESIRKKALLEASTKFAGHSNYHGDTILCTLISMAEGQEVADAKTIDYFSGN